MKKEGARLIKDCLNVTFRDVLMMSASTQEVHFLMLMADIVLPLFCFERMIVSNKFFDKDDMVRIYRFTEVFRPNPFQTSNITLMLVCN